MQELVIVALPDPSDSTVWSVGRTLPDGTYVGVGVHDEELIEQAKDEVRRRVAVLEAA